jgi:uncharacterized protein (TIGR00369 family)
MVMTFSDNIPAGFRKHTRRSGLTDPWEPLYACTSEQGFTLGLHASDAHVNSRGFVHGGLISALADNAMGLSCGMQMAEVVGLVTINLNVDFLGVAHHGDWIEIRAVPVRTGKSICFAEARVLANGQLCATAKGIFRTLLKQ